MQAMFPEGFPFDQFNYNTTSCVYLGVCEPIGSAQCPSQKVDCSNIEGFRCPAIQNEGKVNRSKKRR